MYASEGQLFKFRDEVQPCGIVGEFAANLIAEPTSDKLGLNTIFCAVVYHGVEVCHPLGHDQAFNGLRKFFHIRVLGEC